jgi:hypothetical protein
MVWQNSCVRIEETIFHLLHLRLWNLYGCVTAYLISTKTFDCFGLMTKLESCISLQGQILALSSITLAFGALPYDS